jgi:hypothetical protein
VSRALASGCKTRLLRQSGPSVPFSYLRSATFRTSLYQISQACRATSPKAAIRHTV